MNDEKILESKKKKILLNSLLDNLVQNSQLYYSASVDVAHILYEDIQNGRNLTNEQRELLKDLTTEDIKLIFGLNSKK